MFITKLYKELKQANIVSSGEDFSVRFLKRSKKYYSSIASQQRDINTDLLFNVYHNLINSRLTFQSHSSSKILVERYKRWQKIESLVAKEIAHRATNNGNLSDSGRIYLQNYLSKNVHIV